MNNKTTGLFHSVKHCSFCGRPLPDDYTGEYCPSCQDNKLFHDVKEYIRSNEVNEFDVAAHFQIPVSKVKKWIREGRIEYKTSSSPMICSHCQHCGAPISFGTLCPKCLKLINSSSKGYVNPSASGSQSKMHYLDTEDE